MRYRILHDTIGPRLHWQDQHDTRPTQHGPWGKGEEVEGEELGDETALKRLLDLGAIEVAPVYPEGAAPEPPAVEKPLAPPVPEMARPEPRPPQHRLGTPSRKPVPPVGRDSGTKEDD